MARSDGPAKQVAQRSKLRRRKVGYNFHEEEPDVV
jgi:hypothetical protein